MTDMTRGQGSATKLTVIFGGLTVSPSRQSSIDELEDILRQHGWSPEICGYRFSLSEGEQLRTIGTMLEDASSKLASISSDGRMAGMVVIGRGLGARLAIESLRPYPDVPLIMWAPIFWLRTSLEIRYRLHEIRRSREGVIEFDGTKVGAKFTDNLKDPTDEQIGTWIVPNRKHVIVYGQDDEVAPDRLASELVELIIKAGGDVQTIAVPGGHPHPKQNVWLQISKIVEVLKNLG